MLKGVNAGAVLVEDRARARRHVAGADRRRCGSREGAGKEGKCVITLLNTTGQPPLAQLSNRALRERLYKASLDRGWGGEFDTTELIAQIVKLRAERAALLGYANHAAYVLEDETALTPAAANGMLQQLAPPAVANARKEAADMQALIDAQAKADRTASRSSCSRGIGTSTPSRCAVRSTPSTKRRCGRTSK